MSSLRWKTIFFDLDGTLANTIPLIVASYQHAFREVLGEEVEEARARAWIGRPLLAALLEEDPDRGHDLDRTYREWNLANTSRLIERYAGVPEMLTTLTGAGADLHVVTSKRRDTARLALVGVGIDHLIDVAGGLEDTAKHKPEPEPLLAAAARVGVEPSRAVYVGDATVDMLAARAAGMSAVAVTWGAGERDALEATGPDTVVDSVSDLTAYLLGGPL
ncbi:HAD family hydrolase [Knoellia sinensis KCTC 19936]|uniref:Tyrosine-protein kinase PtkA n=1 Tax=Knoellia sinensis KCTC 19936 TaxID=1385520 RepID=A0A0A0J3F1_9MICO|nr:HAD-IA family hydrolase [Knoellia sinensis]KGN30647.1 HAD family hydrolase [Knoellia sinensis KCTC 19936]